MCRPRHLSQATLRLVRDDRRGCNVSFSVWREHSYAARLISSSISVENVEIARCIEGQTYRFVEPGLVANLGSSNRRDRRDVAFTAAGINGDITALPKVVGNEDFPAGIDS